MDDMRISIGQVKRDISDLVNRVSYGRERIILTSRGRPKAALVSIADYEQLQQGEEARRLAHWRAWKAQNDKLAAAILARRGGKVLDLDEPWLHFIEG
jgi:prevent-host-death family protein